MKIIQIDGFRGLIHALFIGICLFAGFVIFPGYVAMHYWNKYLVTLCMFPQLNLFQGVLLWGIAALSYGIVFKKGLAISFKSTPELSDEDLDSIIKSAKISTKMRKLNDMVTKSDRVELSSKKDDEKNSAFISSPISINKQVSTEKREDDKVSNIK